MYNKKYRLEKLEEFHKHNSIYDDMEGKVCYLAYLNVGERGWFLCEEDECLYPHRIHTSVINSVDYPCDNQIIVTTENTKFTFTLITNN